MIFVIFFVSYTVQILQTIYKAMKYYFLKVHFVGLQIEYYLRKIHRKLKTFRNFQFCWKCCTVSFVRRVKHVGKASKRTQKCQKTKVRFKNFGFSTQDIYNFSWVFCFKTFKDKQTSYVLRVFEKAAVFFFSKTLLNDLYLSEKTILTF